jgi:hypothetical protein
VVLTNSLDYCCSAFICHLILWSYDTYRFQVALF